MGNNKIEFWARLLDMLNSGDYPPVAEVFKEMCNYLGFGCGFSYESNHESVLFLKDVYAAYKNEHLPKQISLQKELGPKLMAVLENQKQTFFRAGTCVEPLDKKLAELFGVRSMALISIWNSEGELIALIGIGDQRGATRMADDDQLFTSSILNTLANYIKVQMYQKRIVTTQKALESIVDNMGVDIYVNDFYTHEILYANRSMAAPYGGIENMIGKICWQVMYDDKTGECEFCPHDKLLDADGNISEMYSWDYQRPFDGSWFRVLSVGLHWTDGRLAHLISSVDITENKKNEELIRRMASYDSLTNLPNRSSLSNDCETMLKRLEQTKDAQGYVIFFDLDGFKEVNDTFGHHIGDQLLTTIGQKLQDNPLTRNGCYRYGGDEFVILCEGERSARIGEVLDFLKESMSQPMQLESHEITCAASIGVSHYPYDDKTASGLLRKADQAMYVCKNSEKGSTCFYNQGDVCRRSEYPLAFSDDI